MPAELSYEEQRSAIRRAIGLGLSAEADDLAIVDSLPTLTTPQLDWLAGWLVSEGIGPISRVSAERRNLEDWVEDTITLQASDSAAVRATNANPGWRLIATGLDPGGETTLTYGWPWPPAGEEAPMPAEPRYFEVGNSNAREVLQAADNEEAVRRFVEAHPGEARNALTVKPFYALMWITENSYVLCFRHLGRWREGGNDVAARPATAAEIRSGCADCNDEAGSMLGIMRERLEKYGEAPE